MAAKQRKLAYAKEIPRSPNGFLKNLKRSPSFTAWKDAACNSKSLTEHVKIEPREDELPSCKTPTEFWVGQKKQSGGKFQTPGPSHQVSCSSQKIPIPAANPTHHHARMTPGQGSSAKTNFRPRATPNFYAGTKRKATNMDLMIHPEPSLATIDVMKQPVDELFCEVCQASCSSARTLHQHLKGRRHRANLKWRQDKRKSGQAAIGSLRCDLCRIFCADRALLEMHWRGKKHKAKLHALKNGEDIAKKPLRCELCLVSCMNEDLFQMHVNGKQHTARVELARSQKSLMYH